MASYDDTATVSGSVVSIENGADEVGAKSCVVTVRPTLSGVSSVTETQTGRNLWEFGNVDIDTSQAYVMKYFTYPIPAGTYNLSADITSTTTRCQIRFRKEDGSAITQITLDANSGRVNASFTLTETAYRAYVYSAMQTSGYITSWEDVQLEVGSTAHAYEQYQTPTQYTASLGRTIYGGTADIVNGVGQENCTNRNLVGEGFTWSYNTTDLSFPYFTIGSNAPNKASNKNFVCEGYVNNGNYRSNLQDGEIGVFNNTTGINRFCVRDDSCTTLEQFLEKNANTKITYEVTNPTDFTFTGQEVPTRLGYNAFWSEQGDTELTYYKSGYGFTSVTVNKTGKNLFDISKVATTGTTAGISWNVSGNEITISGTATSSGWKTFVEFKLPHKGTYHFHMNATGNVGYFLRGWTQLVGKDVTEVCNDPSQVYRIAIAVTTTGQTYEGTISEIQIEVGDAYTSYEPYEAVSKTAYLHKVIYGGQADVVKGTCEPKNLLKLYLARTSHQGINFSLTDEGLLHMEGTNTSTTASAFSGGNYSTYDACPWKFPAGTYTASSLITADTSKVGSVNFLIRTKTDNVNYSYALKDAPKTFTINDDFGAWFWASVLKTETVNCDVGVQLEKGSTASEYAPHFEPFSFPPISMSTDEGENTLFANEGDSAITYRKAVD